MVLAVCDVFHTQIFVDQVPHGGLSAAKSFGKSPHGLSGVVLCGLGLSLHLSVRADSPRSARSRYLLETSPRLQLGLDQFDSPQSNDAVQRHLRL